MDSEHDIRERKHTMQASNSLSPSLSDLGDPDIARRVAAGDHLAFEVLMRRFNRQLYRTARSILKDDTEAEDALQDAYLKAYRAMGTFMGQSSLSTWLTRIVINEALGRLRTANRRGEVIDLGLSEVSVETVMEDGRTAAPDEALARTQARVLLEQKIDALPDNFRTVFMLRALEEMTVEETAASLGIPEATVRTRYFRARSMLREALAQEIDKAFDQAFSFDGERCNRIVAGALARLRTHDRF